MERAHCVQEIKQYQDGPGRSKPREEWHLVKLGWNRTGSCKAVRHSEETGFYSKCSTNQLKGEHVIYFSAEWFLLLYGESSLVVGRD